MSRRMFKEAPSSALGHAVVARPRTRDGVKKAGLKVEVITDGIADWRDAEGIRAYHAMMQGENGYYDGSYFSVMSPGEYLDWLTEHGEPPRCRACNRPLTPQ